MINISKSFINVYIITIVCCVYPIRSMENKREAEAIVRASPTLVSISSPRSQVNSISSMQTVIDIEPLASHPSDSQAHTHTKAHAEKANAEEEGASHVRVSYCKRVMKISGLTLKVGLVVTTSLISYVAFKLLDIGEKLVPTAQEISYLAQGLIAMGQQGITLAGQVMQQMPDAINMLNETRATCLQAADICQFAQQTCKDASSLAKLY